MNSKFAQARFAGAEINLIDGKLPNEIQFMPPGRHDLSLKVNGEPAEMTVDVGPRYADIFQECLGELQSRASAGVCDEPFLDFNHEDGRASAVPKRFRWAGNDPKKGGVRLEVEWTGSGKEALLNRDYRRFSPQWIFHKDTKEPLGLEVNMGGLVNKAAFKTISPVMASGKSVAVTAAFSETTTESNNMTKDELSQALADALKPIGERINTLETRLSGGATAAAAGQGNTITIDQVKTTVTEAIAAATKPLTEKITTMETNGVKASAKAFVQKHIARGAVPPGDTKTIEFWEKAFIADAASAEEQLAKVKGTSPNFCVVSGRTQDSVSTNEAEPEHAFMAKAKEYATKHNITDEAVAIAKYADTAEGAALYQEFRTNKIVKAQ